MAPGPDAQDINEPWYLAQLKPGGFERAVTNLARQGYQSFMPLREETRRRGGQWDKRQRPLFPGYLFVKVPNAQQNWRSLNATYGISRIVALEAGRPTPVAPELVSELRDRMSEDGLLQPPTELKTGDQVRVVSGPFSDALAEIEAIPEQGRIYVLLELMGRYVKAELAAGDVENLCQKSARRL